jgi:hypothetical protein
LFIFKEKLLIVAKYFFNEKNVCVRQQTSIAQKLPNAYKEKVDISIAMMP